MDGPMKRALENAGEGLEAKRQRSGLDDQVAGTLGSETSQAMTPAQAAAEKKRQLLERMRQLKQQSQNLVSQVDQKISVAAPPAPPPASTTHSVGGGHAGGFHDRPADAYSHVTDTFDEEPARGPKRGRRGRQPGGGDVEGPRRRMTPLDMCKTLINSMLSKSFAPWFREPVDPVKLNLPDYYTVITEPMDLGTVKRKLEVGMYAHHEQVAADVRLIYSNCIRYNGKVSAVSLDAEKMLQDFEKGYEKIKQRAANSDRTTAADRIRLDSFADDGDGDTSQPDSPTIPFSSSSLSSVPRKQREPRSHDNVEPMSPEEKLRLSNLVSQLPEDKLSGIVEILDLDAQDGEIEIDLEKVDPPTLRKLERYVKSCLSKKKRPAAKREAHPQTTPAQPPPGQPPRPSGVGNAQMNGHVTPAVPNDNEFSDSDTGSYPTMQQFQPQQTVQPPLQPTNAPLATAVAHKSRAPASASIPPPPRPSPAPVLPPAVVAAPIVHGLMPPGLMNPMLMNQFANPYFFQGLMATPGIIAPPPAQKMVTVQNLDSWASLAAAQPPAASSPGLQTKSEKASDPLFQNFQKEAKLRQAQEEQRRLEEERLKREREENIRMEEERLKREQREAAASAEEARRRQIEEAREAERRKRESLMQQSQESPFGF